MKRLRYLFALGLPLLSAMCSCNTEPKDKGESQRPPVITIPTVRAVQPIKVVCIGNSITEGYGNSSQAAAWPAQTNLQLGSNYAFYNCGVSGTTMFKNTNVSFWNTDRFTLAKSLNPQILIIALGTNDADPPRWNPLKGEFKADYLDMIAEFRRDGRDPVIYMCLPPPLFGPAKEPQNTVVEDELIPIINEIAAEVGAHIIDYHTPLLNHGEVFPDTVHPNDEGSELMSLIALNKIKTSQTIKYTVTVDKGEVEDKTIAVVEEGGKVTFDMFPKEGGWKWTGPGDFTSTDATLVLNDVKNGGVYTAIHTGEDGMRSIVNFLVSIKGKSAAVITPWISDRNNQRTSATSITTNPGTTITLSPETTGTNDTWSWRGPNAFFSASREVRLEDIAASQAGKYTVVYTDGDGSQSYKEFTVTVAGELVCPTLTSYINYGSWQQVNSMAVGAGDSVTFGPHPSNGKWEWSGPDGFSSTNREATVSNFNAAKAGNYIGTFTNNAGCKVVMSVTLSLQ